MQKIPGDIIILQMCTTNDNHMIYDSRDMERNRHIFLPFWNIFCPFTSLTTCKIKKPAGDIIFHKWTTNHDHMLHCFWDTTQNGCNFYFSVWTIFCRFTPLTTQKINIKKKWKKMVGDVIILNVYQKFWSHDVRFLRYGAQQMEERTEKVTYRGGCTT